MRWNCPHCETQLAISDEKLGEGWSFSKCYKCAGFALLKRKADVNLIKVDKAPPGEALLLPEATEEPLLSKTAVDNLARHMRNKTEAKEEAAKSLAIVQPPKFTPKKQSGEFIGVSVGKMPSPLPDIPKPRKRSRLLMAAISMTAVVTVASGVFLYTQAQTLWKKSRRAMTPASAVVEVTDTVHQKAMAPTRSSAHTNSEIAEGSPTGFKVRLKLGNADLHTGPGLAYPILETLSGNSVLSVIDWNDRWFKISNPSSGRLGWIRNEQAQIVAQ